MALLSPVATALQQTAGAHLRGTLAVVGMVKYHRQVDLLVCLAVSCLDTSWVLDFLDSMLICVSYINSVVVRERLQDLCKNTLNLCN